MRNRDVQNPPCVLFDLCVKNRRLKFDSEYRCINTREKNLPKEQIKMSNINIDHGLNNFDVISH